MANTFDFQNEYSNEKYLYFLYLCFSLPYSIQSLHKHTDKAPLLGTVQKRKNLVKCKKFPSVNMT